jgi:hypothetical protein
MLFSVTCAFNSETGIHMTYDDGQPPLVHVPLDDNRGKKKLNHKRMLVTIAKMYSIA